MPELLLPGVAATRVETPRLTQQVLHADGVEPAGPGEVVLFVHGNASSSLFWQQPLLALAGTGRIRPLAVDLRGYGDTDPLPIDATRGMRDWADDLAALIGVLGLDRVHLVGWSMGAGVVLQYLLDHPERVASVALVAPVSPYGFGGTAGPDGTRLSEDGAGSGAGTANPGFVDALAAGDTTADPRRAPDRSCAPSTSRPARCRWTPSSRTSSSHPSTAPAPAWTTTPATPWPSIPGPARPPAAAA